MGFNSGFKGLKAQRAVQNLHIIKFNSSRLLFMKFPHHIYDQDCNVVQSEADDFPLPHFMSL